MSDHNQSVVVTGVGTVTPLGASTVESWQSLLTGRSGFTRLAADSRYGEKPLGLVPSHLVDQLAGRNEDPAMVRFAASAIREALKQANIDPAEADKRIGLICGSVVGLRPNAEYGYEAERSVRPDAKPRMVGALSSDLATVLGETTGLATSTILGSACASGNQAILLAERLLRSNVFDVVVAGGADELSEAMLMMFHSFGAFSADGAKPFDQRRDGITLGEGSGFVVLETGQAAASRGQTPLAELYGGWNGQEAFHATAQDPDGLGVVTTVTASLEKSGLTSSDIGLVCAHGTGTPLNDRAEAIGLQQSGLGDIPTVSLKGQIGHLQGAASAVEAVCCVAAVSSGRFPGNVVDLVPDEEVAIETPVSPVSLTSDAALLNLSFGFGGSMAATVLGPPR